MDNQVTVEKWLADTRRHLKTMGKNELIRTVMSLVLQLQKQKVLNEKINSGANTSAGDSTGKTEGA